MHHQRARVRPLNEGFVDLIAGQVGDPLPRHRLHAHAVSQNSLIHPSCIRRAHASRSRCARLSTCANTCCHRSLRLGCRALPGRSLSPIRRLYGKDLSQSRLLLLQRPTEFCQDMLTDPYRLVQVLHQRPRPRPPPPPGEVLEQGVRIPVKVYGIS